MRVAFYSAIFLFSTLANAEALDCTKLSLKSFKFSSNCIEGTFKKVKNGSKINPECVVTAKLGERERSIYYAQPERNTDFIGLTSECENHKGHSVKDLPKGCRIFFNFDSMTKLDYKSCTCTNMGCGQHLIQNLNEEEMKELKASIGNSKEAKHNLTKSCNGDLQVKESEDDKTVLMVSSTECIFRPSSTALTDVTHGPERFCIEGPPSERELKNIKENYLTRTVRLTETGRIYALVCMPLQKLDPKLQSAERKNLPLEAYWPKYNDLKGTNEASKVDK